MTNKIKINYKTITFTSIFILSLLYIGSIGLYAKSISKDINSSNDRHGRNSAERLDNLAYEFTPEYMQRQKKEWEKRLKEAQDMLSILEDQRQVSSQDN